MYLHKIVNQASFLTVITTIKKIMNKGIGIDQNIDS